MANRSMTSVIESLPARMRGLFADVVGAHDPDLLAGLMSHEVPSRDERLAVESIFANEFSNALREDSEPTVRGKQVDEMLGVFLQRWPIRDDD
jgi:hypothetical protein